MVAGCSIKRLVPPRLSAGVNNCKCWSVCRQPARSVAGSIMIMPPRADAQDGRERIAVEAFFVASILTEAHAAAAQTRAWLE